MEQSTIVPRPPAAFPPLVIPLAQESGRPLRWRLHQGFRAAILNGQFEPGARLPSTRTLAGSLGISRSTVVEAFDQLAAEGFIERRTGSGTYVSPQLSGLGAGGRAERPPSADPRRRPARRMRLASAAPTSLSETFAGRPMAFTPCEPDVELFPHRLWARMLARHARAPKSWSASPDPAGLLELRQALAAHLTLSRGVTADPDRIIVVSGARQAIFLCAHALLDPGDDVWCEDPGYPEARTALAFAGANVVPVPIDDGGIDVNAAERLAPRARAAYVMPSHQLPTGIVMRLRRRLQLLDWAARNDAWILEDDYDSEFCYDNRPLTALQGLDDRQSVVYIGTLNKITYPGLRLGYVVAPAAIADALASAAVTMSLSVPLAVQAAAADFISEGHLAQHITRMRGVYGERQRLLIDELDRQIGDAIRPEPISVGMHVLAALHGISAQEIAARGVARGLDLRPLSGYAETSVPGNAIVLGYTHLSQERIRSAVRVLAQTLADAHTAASQRPST
ncbi:MocR-like pyridoxine biosynthesis transcription factor PdxR [Nonomuraea guangzhouensis]|uniref:MocR-like pyridoxine biosynthesis transcription factor PdxR n=1 Tax=Nonomuraea guangzhouensis TaxID=1291555 RepID=UPI003FD80208